MSPLSCVAIPAPRASPISAQGPWQQLCELSCPCLPSQAPVRIRNVIPVPPPSNPRPRLPPRPHREHTLDGLRLQHRRPASPPASRPLCRPLPNPLRQPLPLSSPPPPRGPRRRCPSAPYRGRCDLRGGGAPPGRVGGVGHEGGGEPKWGVSWGGRWVPGVSLLVRRVPRGRPRGRHSDRVRAFLRPYPFARPMGLPDASLSSATLCSSERSRDSSWTPVLGGRLAGVRTGLPKACRAVSCRGKVDPISAPGSVRGRGQPLPKPWDADRNASSEQRPGLRAPRPHTVSVPYPARLSADARIPESSSDAPHATASPAAQRNMSVEAALVRAMEVPEQEASAGVCGRDGAVRWAPLCRSDYWREMGADGAAGDAIASTASGAGRDDDGDVAGRGSGAGMPPVLEPMLVSYSQGNPTRGTLCQRPHVQAMVPWSSDADVSFRTVRP